MPTTSDPESQQVVMLLLRSIPFCWLLSGSLAAALLGWPATFAASPQSNGAVSNPIPVRLVKQADGWQLLRQDQPYRVRGAGGEGPLKLLSACGGNSTRTWGVDDQTQSRLDEAHALGMTVTLGVWLEHEKGGFDYDNPDQTSQQTGKVLDAVRKFRNHPALLAWGIGNEVEGELGTRQPIWRHVEDLAKQIHELDPNHPTMTVIAEIGGEKVAAIHQSCPSIDIIGINSYGGSSSLPQRYRAAGGKKPYLVTEFGLNGVWETSKNELGVYDELTSTQKAPVYRERQLSIDADQALCLGSYAFLWGHKQEATATWFGLLLPGGERTAAVDVLQEIWTGQAPANRCPEIVSLRLESPLEVDLGGQATATLQAVDPEHDPLRVEWRLMAETDRYLTNGDFQEAPPDFPESLVRASEKEAQFKVPEKPGLYRIYAFVRDDHGGAATGNVVLRVVDAAMVEKSRKAAPIQAMPFSIYEDATGTEALFVPTGWMGSTEAITLEPDCIEAPHSGQHCCRICFSSLSGWGGVAWQYPANDWGEKPEALDLSKAQKLSFWARGKLGGEQVGFGFGLLGPEKQFPNSGKLETGTIELQQQWKQYAFELRDMDLSRIKTGFFWTLSAQGKKVEFFLDQIRFE